MTFDEFHAISRTRIPTADEFLDFVASQKWTVIRKDDGSPALRVPDKNDPLAVLTAKMLSREPYRTNVLMAAWRKSETPPAPKEEAKELPDRRVVLLTKTGDVERVLWEGVRGQEQTQAREQAGKYPGREVAAEWRKGDSWIRYLTIRGQA